MIARNVIAVESGFNIFGSCSEQHARFSINYVPLWYLVKKYFLQILARLSRMINVNVEWKKNLWEIRRCPNTYEQRYTCVVKNVLQ